MNLAEFGRLIDGADDNLRLETLDRYTAASDVDWVARYTSGGPPPPRSAKATWLARLGKAADRGHPRRRLRVIHDPATAYERYSAEWGYVDNAAAGEVIRVLDAATVPELVRAAEEIGEVHVIDGHPVAMTYDQDRRFQSADVISESADDLVRRVADLWAHAVDFTEWWRIRTDLHRDVHT